MYATERHALILERITQHGKVAVRELASDLDVTPETIRRDLDQLELENLVRRVHGGAVSNALGSLAETAVAERQPLNHDAKVSIGEAAERLIPRGFTGSILIDAGTTTAEIAAALVRRPSDELAKLQVISNSLPILALLAAHSELTTIAIGGRVRGLTSAAVGPSALAQLAALRPDLAFVGTNGISAEFGLSTPDPDEAAVKSAMCRGARRVVVAVDASKFDQDALTHIAPLSGVDALVTDQPPRAALAAALTENDVEAVLA
ncbi:DeoR/GlpR family DNA-binding transcription regulator [Pseudoclavibacter sp. RFBA6]|uniref:DeoR/GlpR family DNA-binding transcription regulator n=1 Tax=Pseudoclavibacter sp. RFBA6 TaxID=2080573 RepID=UPI000CE79F1D|nr:DeoR/GlpR family DNA-binding transcription regulator [Pseudoclavibacter sp. RFBA6]PPG42107.1 D-beta-D-heptose 1-phosphate adenosyltransferase [Pseudoclavibacter sp. RFBA6]